MQTHQPTPNSPVQLNLHELEAASGGLAPVAIALAAYTFFGPFLAAGVAVGVTDTLSRK